VEWNIFVCTVSSFEYYIALLFIQHFLIYIRRVRDVLVTVVLWKITECLATSLCNFLTSVSDFCIGFEQFLRCYWESRPDKRSQLYCRELDTNCVLWCAPRFEISISKVCCYPLLCIMGPHSYTFPSFAFSQRVFSVTARALR